GVATNASAVTTVNGGTVHFKGEVVDAACAVNTNSANQTVLLGQVRSAKLANDGEKSSPVGFSIELNDCSSATAGHASIIFAGNVIATHNDVLSLQNSAAGSATNVGIQILDHTGTAVQFDGVTASTQFTLTDGTNKIPFQAVYYATGKSTPGIANADATFKVQYQ
ncbi:S-fimbrial adhesin major pilin SfaA-I, partial [Escherichia coli]|nr:S-fimbrial adhesin major pilin SfaA-I [Escherichia coli]EFH8246227.1 S-fimbrial adhesin major pilin SfaA-I [Escherichia coli]EFH9511526.1 S-fimbrial adhesin major pilin SfaA-I [Escherichia coli]EFI7732417.1 S-fimbrial adhesin major pilin SfaA-I [Escherichia coli]EFN7562555.1 S-fimbrial adhesin major pilin SfaA-II [Escherichia coli]